LNKITKKDGYPFPLIAGLLDSPGKAWISTKINLQHALSPSLHCWRCYESGK
jgi:hypothetical protein